MNICISTLTMKKKMSRKLLQNPMRLSYTVTNFFLAIGHFCNTKLNFKLFFLFCVYLVCCKKFFISLIISYIVASWNVVRIYICLDTRKTECFRSIPWSAELKKVWCQLSFSSARHISIGCSWSALILPSKLHLIKIISLRDTKFIRSV